MKYKVGDKVRVSEKKLYAKGGKCKWQSLIFLTTAQMR